jgi:DNA repair protein RAD50
LKLITSGAYPPNSQNGKTFIMDPKLVGRPDIKAQIKLKFKAVNKRQVIGIRTFQLTAVKEKKAEMKTVEQVKSKYFIILF